MNKICCPAFCIYQILLSSFAEIENPDIIMKILITILTVPEVMMQMNRSPHITQYIKKKEINQNLIVNNRHKNAKLNLKFNNVQ